jgi:hypothetical protein
VPLNDGKTTSRGNFPLTLSLQVLLPSFDYNTVALTDNIIVSVVSGGQLKYLNVTIQQFPFKFTLDAIKESVQNMLGSLAYPFAFSLLAPSFIHAIVLEKQEKLRELMKMVTNYIASIDIF